MKKLITLVFFLFIIACGNYVKQPVASHVLAVTLEGDTILVAIDKIRPNQYFNYYPVYSQPYYQPYRYDYQWRYNGYIGNTSINKTYKAPAPIGGTTYSNNSEKSISRIDFEKPIKRSKDE
jgi:hypothetical protein